MILNHVKSAGKYALYGICAMTCLNTPAFAQRSDIYFYPTNGWQMLSTPGAANADCIAQAEFNNGFILQFKGASNWVKTLDVNFRQNVFESGKTYNVSLDVPGKITRKAQASAEQPHTLSIPIKGMKDFYAAMVKDAALDLTIEGNEFRFYLTGYNAVEPSFERCLRGPDAQAQGEAESSNMRVSAADLKKPPQQDFADNEAILMEQAEIARTPIVEDVKQAAGQEENQAMAAKQPMPTPNTHRKLSEQLAAQIAADPGLVDTDMQRPNPAAIKEPIVSDRAPLEVPDTIKNMPTTGRDQSGKPVIIDAKPDLSQTKIAQDTTPPAMEEKPVETKPEKFDEVAAKEAEEKPAPQPAPKIATATLNAMMIKTDPASQALLEKALKSNQRVMPVTTGVTTGVTTDTKTDSETQAEMPDVKAEALPTAQEDIAETLIAADTPLPELPEKIIEPVAAKPVTGQSEPLAPIDHDEPVVMEGFKAPHNQNPPTKTTLSAKTPPMKINTEKMSGNADFRHIGAPTGKADTATMARLALLEQEIETLRAENASLNEELDVSLKEGEKEHLSVASENWNLERAAMRYNEAELQIKRMAQELQKERAACSLEKQDLEAMLFDPEVTSQEQLAQLNRLEQELAEARAELARYRGTAGTR